MDINSDAEALVDVIEELADEGYLVRGSTPYGVALKYAHDGWSSLKSQAEILGGQSDPAAPGQEVMLSLWRDRSAWLHLVCRPSVAVGQRLIAPTYFH